ncbi:FAD-dependent oxidoreductase [Deltaproteobacteria bacterium TL4]
MSQNDMIIIGGGISGLSLAFYCARAGMKTTLLEKNDRVGGSFHSHRIQDAGDVFWCELGAHTCYRSYQNLLDIIDECQLDELMLPRAKVPFTMLLNNEITSIFSQINYPELFVSLPRLLFQKKEGQSVASYYSKIIGKRNFEKVFKHLLNAVPSQSTDEFPADILFKKRKKRKNVMKSYTFVDGIQSITDALAKMEGIKILMNKEISSVEQVNGNYHVVTHDGNYVANNLALATPAPVAAQLLRNLYPEISQHLSQIQIAKVNSVGVIIEKNVVPIKPVAGIISPEDCFFSVVSRDTVPDETFRGFTFHFKAEISEHDFKIKRITEVLGIKPSQIKHTVSKVNLVPSLRLGHHRVVNEIDSLLDNKRISLTGNYFLGLSIEDCVSRSLSEFMRLNTLNTD